MNSIGGREWAVGWGRQTEENMGNKGLRAVIVGLRLLGKEKHKVYLLHP